MKSNIALIGFMGAGKTVVGQALARRLNRRFVELDSLIVQRAGKSIPEIFEQDGESAFRELEIEITREVSEWANVVIACGGGIVLNRINIDRLRQKSVIIYLTASPAVTLKRVSAGDGRPLLNVSHPMLTIQQLLRFRKPFYDRAADMVINTSRLSVSAVTERIVEKLKRDEGFNS